MRKINEKTVKHVYTNFCQPELEKFDTFAKLQLKKTKFPNSNLNSDFLKLPELELELE